MKNRQEETLIKTESYPNEIPIDIPKEGTEKATAKPKKEIKKQEEDNEKPLWPEGLHNKHATPSLTKRTPLNR